MFKFKRQPIDRILLLILAINLLTLILGAIKLWIVSR